jgi:hypothetical protein
VSSNSLFNLRYPPPPIQLNMDNVVA